MDVTVILCTLNRAPRLRSTLDDLRRQEMPGHLRWEVLVVDNGSTDETSAVAGEFVQAEPGRFRYLLEPRRGKSNALNAGIQATTASLVAFTDDDVEIDSRWLAEMTRVFEDTGCAGVGGRTLARFAETPPPWLAAPATENHILSPLAQFDFGEEPRRLTGSPFGVNVGFRRGVFDRHGGYRTDLGPTESNRMGRGEDVDLGERVLRAGEVVMYAPKAIIRHVVSADRMTVRYFASWWFQEGRARVRRAHALPDAAAAPRFELSRFVYRMARAALRSSLSLDARARILLRLQAVENLGKTVETVQLATVGRLRPSSRPAA